MSAYYLVGGFDAVTGKQLISATFFAANAGAAIAAAVADSDWVALNINTANTRIIQRLTTDIRIALDQASETTLAAMAANIAALVTEVADAQNSSTTPLGGNAAYTGSAHSNTGMQALRVAARTDQNSATNGLLIEWSEDGTNFISDIAQTFTVTAAADFEQTIPTLAAYHRITYTNGSVAQGALDLKTVMLPRFGWSGTVRAPLVAAGYTWNGTTWEPKQSNTDLVLLASGSRTATTSSADQVNANCRGIKVFLSTTTIGTGSITLSIEGKDPISGNYVTLLSGAAVTTNTTNVYTVYPGAPATANVSANDVLPRDFRVTVTANNANAAVYSVSASLIQ